jgi:hypothetical protein
MATRCRRVNGTAGNAPGNGNVDPETQAARWLVLKVGAANGSAGASPGDGAGTQGRAPTSSTSTRKVDGSGVPQVRTMSSLEGGHPG